MKRLTALTIVLGLLMAVSFTSCKKDMIGVYSPQKKLKRVYYSSAYTDKTPLQHMAWEGDKLASITHYVAYGDKQSIWVEVFTYDGNRVVRVDNYTNSEYITYEYEEDLLKSATTYYKNSIASIWEVSYDGDKINKISGTFFDFHKEDGASLQLNPLTHMLPPAVLESVTQCERQLEGRRHQRRAYMLTLLLTWEDDNISHIVFTGDGEYYGFQLQYDDKDCPWYGFMGSQEDYLANFTMGHLGFSKNNVTTSILTMGNDADTVRYVYLYDRDGYPVLQTAFKTYDIDHKDVLYFDY